MNEKIYENTLKNYQIKKLYKQKKCTVPLSFMR